MDSTASPAAAIRSWRVLPLLWALPIVYGAVFFVLRPSINNDVGIGLRVLLAMRQGLPFNSLSEPDSADISRDVTHFVAAWSPSQYQLPALFQVGGLDLGQAIVLATIFCVCAGIAGWYALYRSFGFSPGRCLAACLLIEAMRHFLSPFDQYDGGEVVLFATGPWATLMLWRMTTSQPGTASRFILTFVAVAIAAYGKLSGFMFITAVLGGAALHCWWRAGLPQWPRDRWRALRPVVATLLPAALAWLVFATAFYFFWIARGWTAVGQPAFHFLPGSLYFPPVSMVIGVFSLNEAIGFGASLVGPRWAWLFDQLVVYAVAAPFCAGLIVLIVRRGRELATRAAVFALAAGVLYTACFMVVLNYAYLYLDDRYFRTVSLLLLPFVLDALLALASRALRFAAATAVLSLACYGVLADAQHVTAVDRRPLGRLGFREPVASPGLLAYFHRDFGPADRQTVAGRVVYVMSSELPLEIAGARALAREADFLALDALQAAEFHGRARELTVVLPVTFLENGKADAILHSFKDYDPAGWKRQTIDARFIAFRQ